MQENMTWQEALREIYRELEEELSAIAPPCRACGECCHFDKFDHTLYVSDIEVKYVLENAGPPSPVIKKGVCPYLFKNKCTIREYRPLGCRIFYCQEGWKARSAGIYEKYHRKIKDLCIESGIEWRYSPLLLSLLSNSPRWRPCVCIAD